MFFKINFFIWHSVVKQNFFRKFLNFYKFSKPIRITNTKFNFKAKIAKTDSNKSDAPPDRMA